MAQAGARSPSQEHAEDALGCASANTSFMAWEPSYCMTSLQKLLSHLKRSFYLEQCVQEGVSHAGSSRRGCLSAKLGVVQQQQ